MSIRRLNYTKRKKLTLDQVNIKLSQSPGNQLRIFNAELSLPSDLPGNARVFVEAYCSSPATRMRFDFGTVDAVTPPPEEQRCLKDFSSDASPLFRVKVTDVCQNPGKILAEAHQIRPVDPNRNKRGILFTKWDELNGPVWELDLYNDDGPVLLIEKTIDPHCELPRQPIFQALVFPEIIRRVLTWVLSDDEIDNLDDPTKWHSKWLDFPRVTFDFTEPVPKQDDDAYTRMQWVNEAVKWCSRRRGFCKAFDPKDGDE